MGFTKATLWMGKPITMEEIWCEVLGQTWSNELEDKIWDCDYGDFIIWASQGHQVFLERISRFITDLKTWENSIKLLENNGQKLKLIAHDQVKSGYVSTSYFIGHEFTESVSMKELSVKEFPKDYRLYVLQDDCLCCN